MSTLKRNLTIVLGVAAGAALTAFAVSRTSKDDLKKIGSTANKLRDDLFKTIAKDLTKIKRTSNQFI